MSEHLKTYELQPEHENRKSYYGKAVVISHSDHTELISYKTHVATVYLDGRDPEIYGFYSATTLRHIKEFLMQAGYPAMSKKELEKFEV